MDLYSGLRLPLLTVDERLDVLLHVKWTVRLQLRPRWMSRVSSAKRVAGRLAAGATAAFDSSKI